MLDLIEDRTRFHRVKFWEGEPTPRTWRITIRDGKFTAKIVCPDCKTAATLDPKDHTIQADGSVTPSVVCDCGYHETITLADWSATE